MTSGEGRESSRRARGSGTERPRVDRRPSKRGEARPPSGPRAPRSPRSVLPKLLAGGALVGGIALAVVLASGGGSSVTPEPLRPASEPPRLPAAGSPAAVAPRPTPSGPESIDAAILRLEAERDESSAAVVKRLVAWQMLDGKTGSSQYADRIAAGVSACERKLEALAPGAFARTKEAVAALIAERRFDEARSAWSKPDPALAGEAWSERISRELEAIDEAQRAAQIRPIVKPVDPPDPPTAVAPPPAPPSPLDRPKMVPADWTRAGESDGLFGCHPDGKPWTVSGGVFSLRGAAESAALGGFVHRVGPHALHRLRNFYVGLDFMVVSGSVDVCVLLELNTPTPAAATHLDITESSGWLRLGQWHRLHLMFGDGYVRHRIEGAREGDLEFPLTRSPEARQGALLFTARPGSDVRVRPFALWIGKVGDAIKDK